tara:strand:+ start:21223 stop:21450 length:228 start_codon:yes stop_codon:yes gene_type:complete
MKLNENKISIEIINKYFEIFSRLDPKEFENGIDLFEELNEIDSRIVSDIEFECFDRDSEIDNVYNVIFEIIKSIN